ncbi:MAG: 50S ribosomal protein L10 [Deltaproteobacteria bacterium]|nr:50S ribosomal protein L10 [Deltaproteobacteria bacterium]
MAKMRSAKVELGKEIAERFKQSKASIIAEYRGMKAEELRDLRVDLRAVGCEFQVVKNRIARKAIMESVPELAELAPQLKGPLGVVYLKKDVGEGTKTVIKFTKEKSELFKITGGVIDGRLVSTDDIDAIATLPSREVLLARMLGSLIAPHRRLMGVVNGVAGNLVRTIAAIRDKKSQ